MQIQLTTDFSKSKLGGPGNEARVGLHHVRDQLGAANCHDIIAMTMMSSCTLDTVDFRLVVQKIRNAKLQKYHVT